MILTAHSVPSFSQDSICFSLDEAKHVFKLANKGRWCDSLSLNYEAHITYLEETVRYQDAQIEIGGELVQRQKDVINTLTEDLQRSEKRKRFLGRLSIGLGVAVVLETIWLLK